MKNIVVLAFEGAQVLDITGPMEVFSSSNQFASTSTYRVDCLGVGNGVVRMSNGLALAPTPYSRWSGRIDTLIVPGSSEDALIALRRQTEFLRWLSVKLGQARRVMSVCTGAFILAELGFLEGKAASTHWAACDRLEEFAPNTHVDRDAIYTKDGNVYTSAGVTAGIDLALGLVEEDLGRGVALDVARNLVLYLRRQGGQSQFSASLAVQSAEETRLDRIKAYIQNNAQANLSVDALADRFSMSTRHLSRLFVEEADTSPGKFVAQTRLDSVRRYLETTELDLKKIAAKCGFSSQSTMSKVFRQRYGVPPGEYRARFN